MTTKYMTKDLKTEIDSHGRRIGELEKADVRHEERITSIRKEIADICNQHKEYEEWRDDVNKILTTSQAAIKIGTWIVVGFGLSVIALIWSLITGQASYILR